LNFEKYGCRLTSHLFFAQIGTSYVPTVAMSNWPPPVAMSEVTFWRSVFSGSVTYLTLMPYCFVNDEVSDCITTMSGLFTVAIVIVVALRRPDWALLVPTRTARLSATTPPRLIAKRDKRIFAPFIGLGPPVIGSPGRLCGAIATAVRWLSITLPRTAVKSQIRDASGRCR